MYKYSAYALGAYIRKGPPGRMGRTAVLLSADCTGVRCAPYPCSRADRRVLDSSVLLAPKTSIARRKCRFTVSREMDSPPVSYPAEPAQPRYVPESVRDTRCQEPRAPPRPPTGRSRAHPSPGVWKVGDLHPAKSTQVPIQASSRTPRCMTKAFTAHRGLPLRACGTRCDVVHQRTP